MENVREFIGHYHAFFVHFPIALIIVGSCLQLAWSIRPADWIKTAARVNLTLGSLGTLPAVISGLIRGHNPSLEQIYIIHRGLGLATLVWAVIYLLLSILRPTWMNNRIFGALWAVLGCLLVICTGYFGGILAE